MKLISSIHLGECEKGKMALTMRLDKNCAEVLIFADGRKLASSFRGDFELVFHIRHAARRLRDIRFLEHRYGRQQALAWLTGEADLPTLLPGWPYREAA